jgi:hypothetical protein
MFNERGESDGVIRMLVGDQNRVHTSEIFTDSRKSLNDFPTAQARVNQQPCSTGPDERRIARAAARQYADLDDEESSRFRYSYRLYQSFQTISLKLFPAALLEWKFP